jgi:serine/threonine protein kinase
LNTSNSLSSESPRVPLSELVTGQKLSNRYVLGRRVDMEPGSVVWLAFDEARGKEMTLHFLPEAVRADALAMASVRQAFEKARWLIHANVLRVYDLLVDPQWAAILSDRIEGDSLAALLARKNGAGLEVADIEPWVRQICAAVDEAHKLQLSHGNLSGTQIFVQKSGRLVVANCGFSQWFYSMEPAPSAAGDIAAIGAIIDRLLTGSAHGGEPLGLT